MIKTIGSLLGIIAIFFAAYIYIDSWKADAEALEKTNLSIQQMKIEFKIEKMENRYNWLGDEIFRLQEKYRNKRMPEEVRVKIHEYEEERNLLEMKLKKYYNDG